MSNKEELVRILAPLITKNGDIAATTSMLQEQTVEKLQWMYNQQPEVARQAISQGHQIVSSDPQLQAEREALAKTRQEVVKATEDLAWTKFFVQHSQDPTGALADCGANRAALNTTAISLTKDGVITLAALNESLTLVERSFALVRTAVKKPA